MIHEFYECLCWSFYSFSFGVFLREFAPNAFGRWLGRAGVLCAMMVLIFFGQYSIRRCAMLANANSKDVQNGFEISAVPAAKTYSVTTAKGRTLSWSADSDLSLSGATERSRWSIGGFGQRDNNGAGTSGSFGIVRGIAKQSVRCF